MSVIHTPAGDKLSYTSEEIDRRLGLMGLPFGNLVANGFNQLVRPTLATTTGSGVTVTNNGDGSYTINGTATAAQNFVLCNVNLISGHKYALVRGGLARAISSDGSAFLQIVGGSTSIAIINSSAAEAIIGTSADTAVANVRFRCQTGVTYNNVKFYPMVIDLTAMYGAGKEPTVEQFKAMFPDSYYPYQSGAWADLLWTNPNPATSFAPQTIASSGYAKYFITFRQSTSDAFYIGFVFDIAQNQIATFAAGINLWRIVTVTASGVQFVNGYKQTAWNNFTSDDTKMIPQKIWGIR